MSLKAILGSSLLSCALALVVFVSPVALPQEASAQIIIGSGSSLNHGRPITCPQGARLLRTRGFRDVIRDNCRGRYFTYRAIRNGNRYEIGVRQRDGRIVDVRRTSRRW
ncbi:hypothetical protein AS026_25290 [Rhizobium altiplani]|jgi:hypothetical protein|uniref:PepSY domain-containing protein n=1 Tax=Rhizobium altiplani TaxID=1864509 RepID=A0A109J1X6_9HYPH|nr:hypothetical protein [Rhizobium altiplani]KWV40833.1 hypothetical protein AS026_25290 [Rhizobium altiplani]NMN70353.1 hypothetical protein [Rhizobium sp. 57MFTsu3.2]